MKLKFRKQKTTYSNLKTLILIEFKLYILMISIAQWVKVNFVVLQEGISVSHTHFVYVLSLSVILVIMAIIFGRKIMIKCYIVCKIKYEK